MKLTIESTEQIVVMGTGAKARVWTGMTDTGIVVQLLVARVAVPAAEDQSAFERELTGTHAPAPLPSAFPLRMVL